MDNEKKPTEKKLNQKKLTEKRLTEKKLNEKKLKEAIEICGKLLADRSKFVESERNYKLKIAEYIRSALQAAKDGSDLRAPLAKAFGSPNNLTSWQAHDDFMRWAADNPDAARHALQPFNDTGLSIEERVNQFFKRLPESAVAGFGTRLMLGSFFLFGSDPKRLVPYRYTAFDLAERLLEWPKPGSDLSPGETYARHLEFVQELEKALRSAGCNVRDTLDAQGLLWYLTKVDDPAALEWRGETERFWWVNQGESYEPLHGEDYLWCPQAGDDGRKVQSWDAMKQLRAGDIVLHYAWQEIRAVSRVIDQAAAAPDPHPDDASDKTMGWLVRVSGEELAEPIPLDAIPLQWRTAVTAGGPFNKNGNVNQGYLFRLDNEFSRQFLDRFAHLLPWWILNTGRRILKVAPGRKGQYWNECLQGGYICVGWDAIDDLRTYESEVDLRTALLQSGKTGHPGTVTQYARALWAYRNLRAGDLIVANHGLSYLLGVGTVLEPGYEYRPDRANYRHIVNVQWDTSMAGPIPKQSTSWRNAIVPLAKAEYQKLRDRGLQPRSGFDDLISNLNGHGFFFPVDLVSNYLLALQAKRFVILTGISGTGKTRLAMLVAQYFQRIAAVSHEKLHNYRVIAVRPDWTDNRGLLGYYNPLTERYVATEFLRLLLDARQEEVRAAEEKREPHPFFVILDEMNLARVEHYFSDFLSALESGEEIELHDSARSESADTEDGTALPRLLTIPGNLFFTGTVNVDETTFMFSPKVLDRAFTLELNKVDLRVYGGDAADQGDNAHPLALSRMPGALQLLPRPSRMDWDRLAMLEGGAIREMLIELHEMLADHNRHFGFRVANEIARFVTLAAEQAQPGDDALWAAFDLAVLQKVLPKFHGTQQELEDVLRRLFAFAVNGQRVDSKEEIRKIEEEWQLRGCHLEPVGTDAPDPPTPRLPRTAAKVRRMLDRLGGQGFTAYVE